MPFPINMKTMLLAMALSVPYFTAHSATVPDNTPGTEEETEFRRLLTDSLSKGNHTAWTLPDSLEPNASMNFYLGVKGEEPREGYPVFLYLHGSGPREAEWTTGLALAKRFQDGPDRKSVV